MNGPDRTGYPAYSELEVESLNYFEPKYLDAALGTRRRGWAMRKRYTGLLLSLLFLVLAVPVGLSCCFGSAPLHDDGWSSHQAQPVAAVAAAVSGTATVTSTAAAPLTHECADHPAPPQNPYIETSNGSGRAAAVSRTSAAASYHAPAMSALIYTAGRPHDVAADSTGPPLWLSTCVSRT